MTHDVKVQARNVDFEAEGGIPDEASERVAWTNGILLNKTLNSLQPGEGQKANTNSTFMNNYSFLG